MQHEKLVSTHRRLTFLFTGLVFFIVCILGFSTLGAKYFNEQRIQKTEFKKSSEEIKKLLESENIVLQTFFLNQFQERRKFENREKPSDILERRPFLSFFILDENNDIVFENILEKADFGNTRIPEDDAIYRDSQILYRSIDIDSSYGKKVIFYTKLHYDLDDFMRDSMILLTMISLFSALFYFLGYRFVERALKPVEENLADMTDFIHNAGHELKTPLAVMRGNIQIMQAEEKIDKELMKQSLKEIDHMSKLIESLRELSEIGKLTEKQKLNLVIEVQKAVDELQHLALSKDVTLENTLTRYFFTEANPQELHVLLTNIIKNAIKYNKV